MKCEENLHKGHRERMRAFYHRYGLPAEPHKQVEMLLYGAHPRADTNEIAHGLINRFGSLKGVLDAGRRELEEVEGVGENIATYLRIAGDIARMYNMVHTRKDCVKLDSEERRDAFIKRNLDGEACECILLAYLDSKKRLIEQSLHKDSSNSTARIEASVRLTVKTALQNNSSGVLAGHNHPNGSPMPSQQDVMEAKRLKAALLSVNIELADFVILGEDGEIYSMARGGLLY
jgi:DNA repair protein RadC